jgi:Rieske 2Fe-2S family protein
MNHRSSFHPASPILDFCPPSLPARWYTDPAHHARELAAIQAQSWIYVGRVNDLAPLTLRKVEIAGQRLFLVKDDKGGIRCFYNTCRHRGSELCQQHEQRLKSKLITCPYHEWSYDLSGRLVRVPHVPETPGFDKEAHGLFSAQVKLWNGFIFVCLSDDPPDFATAPDLGVNALDNWPMDALVTGHRMTSTLQCNWKVFWENYNECLHCPGIHPSLCDMVPVYGKGVMGAAEMPGWSPEDAVTSPLKPGACTWTVNGKACGAEFPNLTEAQRTAAYTFVTLMPTMYIVAHVDYVRAVTIRPVSPEETELTAEWLFAPETLAQPDFDLANVVDFAATVIREDGAASEMNQRGLRNARFEHGTLMPQEFDVFNFQQWVRRKLGEPLVTKGVKP